MINLDDRKSKGTYLVLLFIDRNTAVYVDSFGIYSSRSIKQVTKYCAITAGIKKCKSIIQKKKKKYDKIVLLEI